MLKWHRDLWLTPASANADVDRALKKNRVTAQNINF